ncbi:hypothetical protein WT59_20700 [Burkholderia territorii]|nr:hypothetical protein WT59_20700 [Burkholderia territorii]
MLRRVVTVRTGEFETDLVTVKMMQQDPCVEYALFILYRRQCLGKEIRRPVVVNRLYGTRTLLALVGRREVLETGRIIARRNGNRSAKCWIDDEFVVAFVLFFPATWYQKIPQGRYCLVGQHRMPVQPRMMGR